MTMHEVTPAITIAAEISARLIQIVTELLSANERGEPKDDDKYGMISDLIIKFETISDIALQEEENSKEGIEFLHKISNATDNAVEAIDGLMDEFYTSHIVTFDEFKTIAESVTNTIKEALEESDIKNFLIMDHSVEEGRRDLDYIPYMACGWDDIEMEMCNNILENLDMFYIELIKKCDRILGEEFCIN